MQSLPPSGCFTVFSFTISFFNSSTVFVVGCVSPFSTVILAIFDGRSSAIDQMCCSDCRRFQCGFKRELLRNFARILKDFCYQFLSVQSYSSAKLANPISKQIVVLAYEISLYRKGCNESKEDIMLIHVPEFFCFLDNCTIEKIGLSDKSIYPASHSRSCQNK